MRKAFLLLVAMVMMSIAAWSAPLVYYIGPGFDNKLGSGNDATQVGTVPQPGSPTPPLGSFWLAYGTLAAQTDYIHMPNMLNGLSKGVVEFYLNIASGGFTDVFESMTTASDHFYIVTAGGNMVVNQDVSGAPNLGVTFPEPSQGADHKYRIEFSAGGLVVYVDNVNVGSDSANPWSVSTYTGTTDIGPNNPNHLFGFNAGITGFMIGSDNTDTYPPTLNTPTITRTFSVSPTFSPSPTITKTFTVSATPSITRTTTPTPSITPTPATLPPTNIRVGILQPNSTINLTWDASSIPSSWIVWFNDVQKYFIPRSDVRITGTGEYSYLMQNLPAATNVSLKMFAQVPGRPTSPPSQLVLFTTALAPFSYFLPLGLMASDKYTAAITGPIYATSSPVQKYWMTVCGEGGNLSTWSMNLQGSLDGVHFTTFLNETDATPECTPVSNGNSFFPFTYIRVSFDYLTLGTATDALVLVNGLP